MFYSLLDISVGILATILLFVVGFIYSSYKKDQLYDKYYTKALGVKILGALIFILTYSLVYGGLGDSYRFYLKGEILFDRVLAYPSEFFELLFSSKENLVAKFSADEFRAIGKSEDFTFTKITMVLMFFGFKNYFLMTLFSVLTTFYGSWKLFLSLTKRYKKNEKIIFIAVFLIPSVLFWGSTFMKDAFVLGLFNLFVAKIINLQLNRKAIHYISLVFLLLFLSQIKAYVIISFLPSLILYIFLLIRKKIESQAFKVLFTPIMFVVITTISGLGMVYVGELSERYKLEEIEARTKGFHSWHSTLGGSAYDLGEIEYTFTGIVTKAPEAISITLIRPFPNEVKNSMMLIGALESLMFLILILIYIVIKKGLLKWFKSIFRDPFLLSSLVFVLVFSFVVGFTSYNYGALFRYKIPCMSFYFLVIMLPYFKEKTQVNES